MKNASVLIEYLYSKNGKFCTPSMHSTKYVRILNQNLLKIIGIKKAVKTLLPVLYSLVPGAGIEPARPQRPQDFKSFVHLRFSNVFKLFSFAFLCILMHFRTLFPHSDPTPIFEIYISH